MGRVELTRDRFVKQVLKKLSEIVGLGVGRPLSNEAVSVRLLAKHRDHAAVAL
jgi:hypothetical protein